VSFFGGGGAWYIASVLLREVNVFILKDVFEPSFELAKTDRHTKSSSSITNAIKKLANYSVVK